MKSDKRKITAVVPFELFIQLLKEVQETDSDISKVIRKALRTYLTIEKNNNK